MSSDFAIDEALDFPGDLELPDGLADMLFRHARTVRTFGEGEVTSDEISAAYDLIKWGPTALNSSPMRLLIVRTPEARARLVERVAEGNRERVSVAPVTMVVAYDPKFYQRMDYLAPQMEGLGDTLAKNQENAEAMARLNSTLQAGYFIVGLRAAGLATAPMNGMDAAAIDVEFFAETGWRSFMLINVSQREGASTHYPRAPRFNLEDVSVTV